MEIIEKEKQVVNSSKLKESSEVLPTHQWPIYLLCQVDNNKWSVSLQLWNLTPPAKPFLAVMSRRNGSDCL